MRLFRQVFDLQEYRPAPVLKRIWKNFQAQQDAGDTWAPIVRGCCPLVALPNTLAKPPAAQVVMAQTAVAVPCHPASVGQQCAMGAGGGAACMQLHACPHNVMQFWNPSTHPVAGGSRCDLPRQRPIRTPRRPLKALPRSSAP